MSVSSVTLKIHVRHRSTRKLKSTGSHPPSDYPITSFTFKDVGLARLDLVRFTPKLKKENEKDRLLTRLNECFKLIGAQPAKLDGKIQDVFVEDFRRELAVIESPLARRLFVLAKLTHLLHLHIGEYVALTAAADVTGNHAVGLLLETCLADKLTFVERTRRLIRNRIAERVAATA
jgi:ferritin-like metal-binding protein YciE